MIRDFVPRPFDADRPFLYPSVIGCDEAGRALFKGEDVKAIESLPWPAVDVIARAILKFNRMGEDDSPKE